MHNISQYDNYIGQYNNSNKSKKIHKIIKQRRRDPFIDLCNAALLSMGCEPVDVNPKKKGLINKIKEDIKNAKRKRM